MVLRLHVAYEGTDYHGWQVQPECPTIEGELTEAAATILDRPVETVKVQGASRTDSGVHAVGQVAHLVYERDRSPWDFVRGLNALTDDDICVTRAEQAPESFHARYSARAKIYRYEVWNHRFQHPLRARRSWRVRHALDLESMRRAAAEMEGTHDFEAFRAADCDSETTERTMERVDVDADGPRVRVTVEGDAFLKQMVRVMVGTLVDIGRGRLPADIVEELFASRDRGRGGITAPAAGLTLHKVFYPEFPWKGDPPEVGGEYLIGAPG